MSAPRRSVLGLALLVCALTGQAVAGGNNQPTIPVLGQTLSGLPQLGQPAADATALALRAQVLRTGQNVNIGPIIGGVSMLQWLQGQGFPIGKLSSAVRDTLLGTVVDNPIAPRCAFHAQEGGTAGEQTLSVNVMILNCF